MNERKRRHEQLTGLAAKAFSNHDQISCEDGRWYIASSSSVFYWAEVVWLRGGKLLVHGDIEAVIFDGGGDFIGIERARFFADSDIDYITSKASMGMGSDLAMEIDPSVMAFDLRVVFDDMRKQPPDYCDDKACISIREAIEQLNNGVPTYEVIRELYDRVDNDWSCIGRVPSVRIYYAHGALKKLCELMRLDHAAV